MLEPVYEYTGFPFVIAAGTQVIFLLLDQFFFLNNEQICKIKVMFHCLGDFIIYSNIMEKHVEVLCKVFRGCIMLVSEFIQQRSGSHPITSVPLKILISFICQL